MGLKKRQSLGLWCADLFKAFFDCQSCFVLVLGMLAMGMSRWLQEGSVVFRRQKTDKVGPTVELSS